jgi:serine protease
MHNAARLVSAAAIAALLAACSGGTGSNLPSTNDGQNGPTTQSLAPRAAVGSDGHTMVFIYNKQAELSGLVSGPQTPAGARTPLSVITGAMTYHGGPIQTAPKIYVVEWGSASQWSSTGDPAGEAAYYTKFISGVGGSQWLSSVTQYTQSNGQAVGNASGSYVGSWADTVDPINTKSLNSSKYQSILAAEAQKAAAHFGDYSASASYVILIPHGVKVYQFAGNFHSLYAYCAWHSSTSASGGTIAYTNFPYQSDAGSSCGEGSVNSPGTNDGVSIVGGHEQAETETDPQPDTGWLDANNNENGDKCAWTNLQNTSFSTGTFPTQPLWSNAANGCVQ